MFYDWDSVKYPLSVGCPACQWFRHPFSKEQIVRNLGGRKRRCSSFVKLYLLSQEKGQMISQDRHYVLPNMRDKLVVDLTNIGYADQSFHRCLAGSNFHSHFR